MAGIPSCQTGVQLLSRIALVVNLLKALYDKSLNSDSKILPNIIVIRLEDISDF